MNEEAQTQAEVTPEPVSVPVVAVGALVRYVFEVGSDLRVPVLAIASDGTLTLRVTDMNGKPYDVSAVAYDKGGALGSWHEE